MCHNDTGKVAKESHLNNFVKGVNNLVTTGSFTTTIRHSTKQWNRKDSFNLSQFEDRMRRIEHVKS